MKTNNNMSLLLIISLILLVPCISAADDFDMLYSSFRQAIQNNDDPTALDFGHKLFTQLEKEYRADVGFGALKSKLVASEFLSKQMILQLQKANGSQMHMITGRPSNRNIYGNAKQKLKDGLISVAPAKSFYETSTKTFQMPIDISNLSENEITFLRAYYNLTLRKYTSSVAKAGQALTIARPDFKDTHHYVLVLPLLHFKEPQQIPFDVLPRWMHKSAQLKEFSDSCLTHYGLTWHGMTFARSSSKDQQSFSELDYYESAAKNCETDAPHIAADCLKRSLVLLKDKSDQQVAIHNKIIQLWLDNEKYELAASEAKHLTTTFQQHPDALEARWLYFYALSRANNSPAILKDIDDAIEDPKCQPYRAKMLYIKWWALRRQRDQMPRVAAIEHELIKLYSDNPMVAPIMLSRATDLLASQDYNNAYEILTKLNENFPNTKAAQQSKRIMEKLKTLSN